MHCKQVSQAVFQRTIICMHYKLTLWWVHSTCD